MCACLHSSVPPHCLSDRVRLTQWSRNGILIDSALSICLALFVGMEPCLAFLDRPPSIYPSDSTPRNRFVRAPTSALISACQSVYLHSSGVKPARLSDRTL